MSIQQLTRQRPKPKAHPATFSDAILAAIARHLVAVGTPAVVVDPFAGTGRVHELRALAGVESTVGVELEPEWASLHHGTIVGDALRLTEYVGTGTVDAIVTSPTYGNRMADHHNATDDSVRLTYRHTLGRELTNGNSGAMQWGEAYRAFHRAAWREVVAALRPGGTFTLNCKNHVRRGVEQLVTEWHLDFLEQHCGLVPVVVDRVPTRGVMAGANADKRAPFETVATFRKPTKENP